MKPYILYRDFFYVADPTKISEKMNFELLVRCDELLKWRDITAAALLELGDVRCRFGNARGLVNSASQNFDVIKLVIGALGLSAGVVRYLDILEADTYRFLLDRLDAVRRGTVLMGTTLICSVASDEQRGALFLGMGQLVLDNMKEITEYAERISRMTEVVGAYTEQFADDYVEDSLMVLIQTPLLDKDGVFLDDGRKILDRALLETAQYVGT